MIQLLVNLWLTSESEGFESRFRLACQQRDYHTPKLQEGDGDGTNLRFINQNPDLLIQGTVGVGEVYIHPSRL